MTTDIDIITALARKLEAENTRLRAENAELRAGRGRWLAQVKAEAWIEGYYACHQDYQRKSGPMLTPNPYREEAA